MEVFRQCEEDAKDRKQELLIGNSWKREGD